MAFLLSYSRAMKRGFEVRSKTVRLSEVAPIIAVHRYLSGNNPVTLTDTASESDNSIHSDRTKTTGAN